MSEHASIVIYNSILDSPVIISQRALTRDEARDGRLNHVPSDTGVQHLRAWGHRHSRLNPLLPEATARPSSLEFLTISQILVRHSVPLVSAQRAPEVQNTSLGDDLFDRFPLVFLSTLVA